MSSQYGELRPTNGWDQLASLGHSSKFQWVSHLGSITAPTSLSGGQPDFAWCLAVSWAGTLYIHFRRLLPLTEFCHVQSSLCVQVLRSPVLAALMHGTPAADVSQILRHGTRNGIAELSQRTPPIFGWAAITLGRLGIGTHFWFIVCCFCLWKYINWIINTTTTAIIYFWLLNFAKR